MSEVPTTVLDALRRADHPDAGPTPGELWRVRDADGHTATLALVRSVDETGITIVPVTFDVELADDTTTVVGAADSPLGVELAVHHAAAFVTDPAAFIDRMGPLEPGDRTGPPIVSPLDERAEFAASLGGAAYVEDADWWPAGVLLDLHRELAATRPAARVIPRADAVALVREMDAFVLVVEAEPSLDAARRLMRADHLLSAVCMLHQNAATVIDRRDVVDAIETPSGELRPPRRMREPIPIGEALVKYLDSAISPFGRLAATAVDAHTIDPRDLAVDAAAEAVRAVEASARGFKVEGKRPGYQRVGRHKAAIVELIETALADPDIDVAAFLESRE